MGIIGNGSTFHSSGYYTFLFTDMVDSTKLWEQFPEEINKDLHVHFDIVRSIIGKTSGHVFKTVGDAVYAVFNNEVEAITAALNCQLALQKENWELGEKFSVRMAIGSGEAREYQNDYYGPVLNLVSRIEGYTPGGQIYLSQSCYERYSKLMEAGNGSILPGFSMRNIGSFNLRNISEPQNLYKIDHPGLKPSSSGDAWKSKIYKNLPSYHGSCIGRVGLMNEYLQSFNDGSTRVLTIVGEEGCGKSRFAGELAHRLVDLFPDGALYLLIPDIPAHSNLADEILKLMRAKRFSGETTAEAAARVFSDKRIILLLDDMTGSSEERETIVDYVGNSELRLILTSSGILGISGETVCCLDGLSMEKQVDSPSDAAKLFLTSFKEQRGISDSWNISDEHAEEVACLLKGNPRAISLAASKMNILSVESILQGIDQSFPITASIPRLLIPWFSRFITFDEWTALYCLSNFATSFSLDDADTLLSSIDLPLENFGLMDNLERKNCLQTRQIASELRFTIKPYIFSCLEEKTRDFPENTEISHALQAWCLRASEHFQFTRTVGETRPRDWALLEEDYINIVAYLDSVLVPGEKEALIIDRLWAFCYRRGYMKDGIDFMARVIGLKELKADLRGRLIMMHSLFIAWLNSAGGDNSDFHSGLRQLQKAEKLFIEAGDDLDLARLYQNSAFFADLKNRFDEFKSYTDKGLKLARRIGYHIGEYYLLYNASVSTYYTQDNDASENYLKEAEKVFPKESERNPILSFNLKLQNASLLNARGNHREAVSRLLEILKSTEFRTQAPEHGILFECSRSAHFFGEHVSSIVFITKGYQLAREQQIPLTQALVKQINSILDKASAEMSSEDFDTYQQIGRSLSYEEAWDKCMNLLESISQNML